MDKKRSRKPTVKKMTNPIERRLTRLEQTAGKRRVEVSHLQTFSLITPVTTGTVFYMSAVSQGTTNTNRHGDRIVANGVSLYLTGIGLLSHNVRVVLVRDTMNQGTLPAVTDILANAGVASQVNYDNFVVQRRFIPIYDEIISVSLNGEVAWNRVIKRKLSHDINFIGATTAVASAASNAHFLLIISDNGTPGNIGVAYELTYTDA